MYVYMYIYIYVYVHIYKSLVFYTHIYIKFWSKKSKRCYYSLYPKTFQGPEMDKQTVQVEIIGNTIFY